MGIGTAGPRRVVVLGGTGFVGRHVSAAFADAGHDVLAVSRRPAPPGVDVPFLSRDLLTLTPAGLAELLDGHRADVVVNATGGVWGVDEEQMELLNVRLVDLVLAALDVTACRPRLVHLGSVHEYGPVPEGACIDEHTPLRPVTPYGRTKLRGSRAVLEATAAGRIDGVVLRIANAVGPGTPKESVLGMVAGQLAASCRSGTPAVLHLAPMRAERDWVGVLDIATVVMAAAMAPVTGRVINVGRGEAISVRVMVDQLVGLAGIPTQIVEQEPAGALPPRGAGDGRQQVDIRAARDLLGWRPQRLEGSLRALWLTALAGV